ANQVNRLKEMGELDRRMELAKIQQTQPNAVLNLAVTYYTGMVDTVAHIPDRCYVADGYEPKEYRTMTWQTGNDATSLRYINFEDQTGLQKVSRNVAYVFYANGEEKDDPLGVRLALQDLRQRYGYYA